MQRLRFVKSKINPSVLMTKSSIVTTDKVFDVTINDLDLTYEIRVRGLNDSTSDIADNGQGKDVATLKKLVKEALKNLGVVFSQETRNRKPASADQPST